jgi:hypothetical protein
MNVLGANAAARPVGTEPLPGKVNYFIGNNRSNWRTGIPTFAKVSVREVYAGIDLVYYGSKEGQFEYDFVVAPGANPNVIRVGFEGVDQVQTNKDGDLVLAVDGRSVTQRRPRVYQESGGRRQELGSAYVVLPSNEVAFQIDHRDPHQVMVIDPALVYSTFLGGSSGETGYGIAVDGSGNAYVTGSTQSSNFPVQVPYQAASGGGTQDVFVTKFNPSGTAQLYSTYLGGAGNDQGKSIAVDGSGNAYVTGTTSSTKFPIANAMQAALNGASDAFVTKLSATGDVLDYSTYLGGSGNDSGNGIAVDGSGCAYVAGHTDADNLSATINTIYASQGGGGDAFVVKLNAAGSDAAYVTYLGGSHDDGANAIAVDAGGSAYITGYTLWSFPTKNPYRSSFGGGSSDAFVAKLNTAGTALVYSTYLGGSGSDSGRGIAVDKDGAAYVVGSTGSTDFPTQSPICAASAGAFLTKLSADGSAPVYSTYIQGATSGSGVAVDGDGNAYLAGSTGNYPTFKTVNPIQATPGGALDAFVMKVNSAGSDIIYSTFLGGSGADPGNGIAVDGAGNAYVVGETSSGTDFQTAGSLQSYNKDGSSGTSDAFVAKISATMALTLSGVSPNSGVPEGGTIVTLAGGNFPGNVQVSFGGVAGTNVTFVDASRLTVVSPAHALGVVDVTVSGSGDIATLAGGFTYEYPPLSLSAVTPAAGPPSGGTVVTLTGGEFPADAQVLFDGVAATNVVVANASRLTAVTPAHAAGAVDVTVTGHGQTATLTSGFSYAEPPVVTSIDPKTGSSIGGTTVTIAGTGFQAGATVKFGTTPAESQTVVSSTQITAVNPSLAAGAVDVTVTNPDGQSSTLSSAFAYWAQGKPSGCGNGAEGAGVLLLGLFALALPKLARAWGKAQG